MTDGTQPQNSYERKLQLILNSALQRFKGRYTPEQYDLELKVAINILTQLGVNP